MNLPTMGAATVTTSVEVVLAALVFGAETGGAAVDSYRLEWDQGTTSWVDITGEDGNY